MKRVLLVLVLVFVFAGNGGASLSADQATAQSRQLWGTAGFARQAGRNYQVGCVINGQTIVVASSKQDYDSAFSAVNMATNGPHVLTAVARSNDGETATSAPVTIYLCNP
jgi:pectate lyase